MATGQVSRILMTTILNRGQLAEVHLTAPARRGLISRLNVRAEPFPILSAYDLTAESQAMVTLVATTESGTINSYDWEQIGGPAVSLNISGNVATFQAPASIEGVTITVRVRGIQDDPPQTSSWVSFQVQVRPHVLWKRNAIGWVPATSQEVI